MYTKLSTSVKSKVKILILLIISNLKDYFSSFYD